jgi:hypothetical protein
MIDELVNEVAQKTGLSPDQAKAAVDAALNFLKARLPAPLAGGLESLIAGGSNESLTSEVGEVLGDLFGKKS